MLAHPAFPAEMAMPPAPVPFDAVRAAFASIAAAAREVAVIVYLDPEWRLLGARHLGSDAADMVTIPIRQIIADALAFDCVAVAMAHNHPSGDPTPSAADYALTQRLARALAPIGVHLVDHMILARGCCVSFRQRGLL
jgi:DNA repair protein RadC